MSEKRPAKVDCIIEGLQILKKYGEVLTNANHDEFMAGPGIEPSDEDASRLELLGWGKHYDGGWRIFT